MLLIEFHPPRPCVIYDPHEPHDIAFAETLEEAWRVIRETYPHATPATAWHAKALNATDPGRWYMAALIVYPHSQAMELDDLGSNKIALISNVSDQPPEPRARFTVPTEDRPVTEGD